MSWRLIEVLSGLVLMPISITVLPLFAELQDENLRFKRVFNSVLALSTIVAFPCFIGLMVIARLVVPLLFGPRWVGACTIVIIMCIAGLGWTIGYCLDNALVALGLMAIRIRNNLAGLAMEGVLLAAAAPFGLSAIGFAIGISTIFRGGLALISLLRTGRVDFAEFRQAICPGCLCCRYDGGGGIDLGPKYHSGKPRGASAFS